MRLLADAACCRSRVFGAKCKGAMLMCGGECHGVFAEQELTVSVFMCVCVPVVLFFFFFFRALNSCTRSCGRQRQRRSTQLWRQSSSCQLWHQRPSSCPLGGPSRQLQAVEPATITKTPARGLPSSQALPSKVAACHPARHAPPLKALGFLSVKHRGWMHACGVALAAIGVKRRR